MSRPDERFLVVTEHGRVLVVVRGDRDGLDPGFVDVRGDTGADDVQVETPLRAFAGKMVELVQAHAALSGLSPTIAAMMVKEKSAEDLKRIDRAARRLRSVAGDGGTA